MSAADPLPKQGARCRCGAVSLEITAAPVQVNACACDSCRRATGSAFSYTAFYPEAGVRRLGGELKVKALPRPEGRQEFAHVCTVCDCTIYVVLDAMPGSIGVMGGCLTNPDIAPPDTFYFTSTKPKWLELAQGIRLRRELME